MEVKSDQQLVCASNGVENTNSQKKKAKKRNKNKANDVDLIADKLESCVNLKQNGLVITNGDTNQSESGHETNPAIEETHEANDSTDAQPAPTVAAAHKKKNKNRNKQKGTAQTKSDNTQSINNNVEKLHDDESQKDGSLDNANPEPPTSTASSVVPEIPKESLNKKIAIEYKVYENELQMPAIKALIQKDLSEPYSIYTYRYFIHNWPKLCFLALHEGQCVGAIVCKLDIHRQTVKRGYIAMLAVDKNYRKLKIGTTLVQKAIMAMCLENADEVVLETEITNQSALRLYENLGFVRDKRLFHYYLNGVDALRLKLWFR